LAASDVNIFVIFYLYIIFFIKKFWASHCEIKQKDTNAIKIDFKLILQVISLNTL